ncbi:hypothetical protein BGP_2380 [Beggiatoa sp. PS]|nr:hypothetical protein BGP_2380 [Beggiatoa sp. PS]
MLQKSDFLKKLDGSDSKIFTDFKYIQYNFSRYYLESINLFWISQNILWIPKSIIRLQLIFQFLIPNSHFS